RAPLVRCIGRLAFRRDAGLRTIHASWPGDGAAARGARAASRVDGCAGVAVSGHTAAGRGPLRSFVLRQLASHFALLFDTRVPRQPLSEVRTPKGLQALGVRRGKATHASAVRCAQLVDELYQRPLGWSLEAAASQLGLTVRSGASYEQV